MTADSCTDISDFRFEIPDLPFTPLLKADWLDALFIHFQLDPAILQPHVPLELDLYQGRAYVSLVAFTQHRLRPCAGGRTIEWLSRPLAHHEFFNLRTYVRRGDERGIFFLAEWIPNRLATLLGPRLYGLPYRLGQLRYDRTARHVVGEHGTFACKAVISADRPTVCTPGSEAAFLLERYTAFTFRHGVLRRFRIHHEPWLQVPAQVTIERRDLLPPYPPAATPCSAHHSHGVHDVLISAPQRLSGNAFPAAAWLPVVLFPAVALCFRSAVPSWALMWLLAFAVFLGFKWFTYCRAVIPTTPHRALGYLFAWPGMDAMTFLGPARTVPPPSSPLNWIAAAGKFLAGMAILTFAVPALAIHRGTLAAWLGMVGITLVLHFGLFDLVARVWQRAGVTATPIMDRPLLARNLSDFWGARWNLAFRTLSHDLVFRPLQSVLGTTGAVLATFFASGLVHELVITLPARGGYGGPTLYFLLQGLAICLERSRLGKRLRLRRGPISRAFAALMLVAPLPLLFPAPFVARVIVPFLQAIGSYSR
jgi:alginate O-acetyltransferase complex protein AlgI